MITINQLMKLKNRDSESIKKARDVLMSMQGKTEVMKDIKVEVDMSHEDSNFDLVVIEQFDSIENFKAYVVHPVHIEVSKYFHNLIDTSACVWYES